jgi:hypothetical protein
MKAFWIEVIGSRLERELTALELGEIIVAAPQGRPNPDLAI